MRERERESQGGWRTNVLDSGIRKTNEKNPGLPFCHLLIFFHYIIESRLIFSHYLFEIL